MKKKIIAIDGPAGVGKTSTAKLVAERLGYTHIDTGAIYRAVAWKTLEEKIDLADSGAIVEMLGRMRMDIRSENCSMKIYMDARDITGELRSREVSAAASVVSAVKEVRQHLMAIQRGFAEKGNIVMEGRDIGTVIFPDADYKFYLDAAVEVRTERRFLELTGKDSLIKEELKKDIVQRDKRDITRDLSPLKKAPDAVVIDSTKMTLEEVVGFILSKIR